MTISSTTRVAGPFTGNGTASAFPFAFKVFAASDLKVVRLNTTTVVETVLVLNSDYTVTLNGNQNTNPGGTVTLVAGPLATGQNLVITTALPNLQPTDLTNQGGFYPEVINDALDRATMQIQQLQEGLDRSVKVPVTQPVSMDQLLADIVTVAADITNVDTVAGSIANVNAVGTNIADVTTVAADLNEPVSEIETVAASITNVDIVGTNIANVNAVGTSIADVNTVAADIADVSTVAADIADVSIVAADIADVSTAATNIAAIIAAPAQAAAAAISATAAAGSASSAATSAAAAIAAANVYPDVATGEAATSSGDLFLVYVTPQAYEIYLNTAGVGVLQGQMNVADGTSYVTAGTYAYSVAFADTDGRVAVSVKSDGELSCGDLACTNISVDAITGQTVNANTVDIGSVESFAYPAFQSIAVCDQVGRVPFAINSDGTAIAASLEVGDLSAETLNGLPTQSILLAAKNAGDFSSEINHVIGYGQSLSMGVTSAPAISTAQPYDSIMFDGGVIAYVSGLRTALVPLVEATQESPCSGGAQMIKQLIADENGIAYTQQSYRLLGSVSGVGAQSILALSKGTANYTNVLNDIAAGYSLSQAAGLSYKVQAFTWTQGEADIAANTPQATYESRLTTLCADIDSDAKATTGQSETVQAITYQIGSHLGIGQPYPSIALAQLAVALSNPNCHMACPMYQFTYTDNVHINNVSSKWLGSYYGLAYKRAVIDKVNWLPLHPVSSFVQGAVIIVKFHVPVKPLVIDTTQVAAHATSGFTLVDSGGSSLAISSVAVVNPDTVKIVASSPVPAGAKLRYAFTGTGAGTVGPITGARGNLRDSQGDEMKTYIDQNTVRRMDNWCVIFERGL